MTRVRPGPPSAKMEGGYSSPDDLSGDERQTDAQTVRKQSSERRDPTNRMTKEGKGAG